MTWKNVNPYIRFGLGVALGIVTFIGLWTGADYSTSTTSAEVVIRVASVMYASALYGSVSYFLAVYVVKPIFWKKARTAEPHFFVAGLSATMSFITVGLAIQDPTTIPLLGDLR